MKSGNRQKLIDLINSLPDTYFDGRGRIGIVERVTTRDEQIPIDDGFECKGVLPDQDGGWECFEDREYKTVWQRIHLIDDLKGDKPKLSLEEIRTLLAGRRN